MKKELFLTSNHSPFKENNKMHTYVSFQYDTQTKELKLVEEFKGKVYELPLGNAEPVSDEESDDNNG